MESDLNIFCLTDELLLDFEPGLTEDVTQRLGKYVVADDVQVVDVGALYGLLSVQGPQAEKVIISSGVFQQCPNEKYSFTKSSDPNLGEVYLMNVPRLGRTGFDLFAPAEVLETLARKLLAAAQAVGGRGGGWEAFEATRIEAGIPRFGVDMDDTNFPQECGIEQIAVSYNKGCYIGQEVLNRIHTMGHVNRELRGLILARGLKPLPAKGEKLFRADKEVGCITSAVVSQSLNQNIGLAIIRRDAGEIGTELELRGTEGTSSARVVALPFKAVSD
jgi:folate-binding protein YgfZ